MSDQVKEIIRKQLDGFNSKNVYSSLRNNVPSKLVKLVSKYFKKDYNKSEPILFAIQGFGTFIVITENSYLMRLSDYTFEMFKKNHALPISSTNLLVNEDNLSGYAIAKITNLKEPKKPLGCLLDLAWPFTKNKKHDIQKMFQVVYEINASFFKEQAIKP